MASHFHSKQKYHNCSNSIDFVTEIQTFPIAQNRNSIVFNKLQKIKNFSVDFY